MAEVELYRSADEYSPKMHLSIRAPNGTLYGIASVELQGLQCGAYAPIDGVSADDLEELLTKVSGAAANIIGEHIALVRSLRDAAMASRSR